MHVPEVVRIDLTKPGELTLENVRRLIASGDDSHHNQIRVTRDGIVYLSQDVVGNEATEDLAFRFETYLAGNDYVGVKASRDEQHVDDIFRMLRKNWPNPTSEYIDYYGE